MLRATTRQLGNTGRIKSTRCRRQDASTSALEGGGRLESSEVVARQDVTRWWRGSDVAPAQPSPMPGADVGAATEQHSLLPLPCQGHLHANSSPYDLGPLRTQGPHHALGNPYECRMVQYRSLKIAVLPVTRHTDHCPPVYTLYFIGTCSNSIFHHILCTMLTVGSPVAWATSRNGPRTPSTSCTPCRRPSPKSQSASSHAPPPPSFP